jgi:hypothetical protein
VKPKEDVLAALGGVALWPSLISSMRQLQVRLRQLGFLIE